jgi:hypothetical protein
MSLLLISQIIIFVSFFAEAIFGFGGGLISIPLLSTFLPVKDSVTIILIFQFLMGFLIFKTYKETDWKLAHPMTIGLLIGTVIGTLTLSFVSNLFLRKFLAIFIILFLIKMIFFKSFTFGKSNKKLLGGVAGLVGGLFQGIIGSGGPIFTMYLAEVSSNKIAFRATLIYLFFITSIVRIVMSFKTGLFTNDITQFAVPLVPIFFIAIIMGQLIHKKIDEKYYNLAIILILSYAAISLLLN